MLDVNSLEKIQNAIAADSQAQETAKPKGKGRGKPKQQAQEQQENAGTTMVTLTQEELAAMVNRAVQEALAQNKANNKATGKRDKADKADAKPKSTYAQRAAAKAQESPYMQRAAAEKGVQVIMHDGKLHLMTRLPDKSAWVVQIVKLGKDGEFVPASKRDKPVSYKNMNEIARAWQKPIYEGQAVPAPSK